VRESQSLRRIVGPVTTLLISLGVAIGSGIFRTPGIVAKEIGSPIPMLGIWAIGGLFVLVSGLVCAELATRFPRAGGEYVFLKEAYGEFVAFFFGWSYSVFIIGAGAGSIAAASGEAAAQLFGLQATTAPMIGAVIVIGTTALNALGLKAGAGVQNVLTGTKIFALVAVALVAIFRGQATTDWFAPLVHSENETLTAAFVGAVVPVMFAFAGTTDAVKMAEEIQDVRRDLPRALIASAFALMLLYVGVNVAFLLVLSPAEMAQSPFVASDVMQRIFGDTGRRVMSFLSLVVFLGALSATVLATVRVTFALARDRLTFSFMSKMSQSQSPVAALCVVGAIATVFTLNRGYEDILKIYYLASAVLFGLTYASLIVFRVRDKKSGAGFPATAFRCPLGPLLAVLLILFELYLAVGIVEEDVAVAEREHHLPMDSIGTLMLLGAFAMLYVVWRRFVKRES
jgi:amino acid transporter